MLARILDALLDFLQSLLLSLLSFLPDSPFHFQQISWGSFGHALGAIFPIGQMFQHMAMIISAYAAYYLVRWVLRVARAIR